MAGFVTKGDAKVALGTAIDREKHAAVFGRIGIDDGDLDATDSAVEAGVRSGSPLANRIVLWSSVARVSSHITYF